MRRKQRVTLRFRHREVIKSRVRRTLVRSAALALIVGFGIGMLTGENSVASQFFNRHTPAVVVIIPPSLAGIAVPNFLPKNSLWLWMPGAAAYAENRLTQKLTAVRAVKVERFFRNNRVVVHVIARVPLVRWNGSGFDHEGILFPMTASAWKELPAAVFLPEASRVQIGQWLLRLSQIPGLWPEVVSLRQDVYGSMELTMKTGTVVIWGMPETMPFPRKSQALSRVLDDAHTQLGGAARADLRFFDQGRIIVRPKSAR